MSLRLANLSTFAIFLAVPLLAHYFTAKPTAGDGIGFDILLYEPFDFAYSLVVLSVFVFVKVWSPYSRASSKGVGLAISVAIFTIWFVTSFLALGELHTSLGGQL